MVNSKTSDIIVIALKMRRSASEPMANGAKARLLVNFAFVLAPVRGGCQVAVKFQYSISRHLNGTNLANAKGDGSD